ncbi:hypothetical protein [Cupriavidus sp. a3]|uniref:hypothetical protein n=1 Tax=Cupriavidus sp. a3 TaxID=3242158 RepID=UPI003D9C458F
MSYTPVVSKYHKFLASAMMPYNGQTLKKHEIMAVLLAKYPGLSEKQRQWIFPSDHCENHVCKGACDCAGSQNAIFRQVSRGTYIVVVGDTPCIGTDLGHP